MIRSRHVTNCVVSISVGTILLTLLPGLAHAAFQCASEVRKQPDTGNQADFAVTGYAQPYGCSKIQVSSNCVVTAVALYIKKNTTPSNAASASIFSDNAGTPSTLLETGGAMSPTPSTSFGWSTSTFAGTTQLNSGTDYWVCASAAGSEGTERYVASEGPASTAASRRYDGSAWQLWNNDTATITFVMMGNAPAAASSVQYIRRFLVLWGWWF